MPQYSVVFPMSVEEEKSALKALPIEIRGGENSLLSEIKLTYTRPFHSCRNFGNFLLSFFPILDWLPKYKWTDQLLGDVFAGLMGGIMNLTKGPAYAILAGIPPVNGLYALMIASFVYPLFASWPQGSMCAFAIIQLMCADALRDLQSDDDMLDPSVVLSTLTFLNGFVFLLFNALHLQFVTKHFSKPLVGGLITAAAIQLVVAQLHNVFGIHIRKSSGLGYLFVDVYRILLALPSANAATIIISITSLLFLVVTKKIVDPPLRRLVKDKRFIVPWELIMVILTTAAIYLFSLDEKFSVRTVGRIPNGIPIPRLPDLTLISRLIPHSLAISVAQLAFHISLSKAMGHHKGYEVEERQEVFALSFTHIVIGFFPVFPTTNGLGRAFIVDECGGTSPIASVVSGLLLLLILLVAGDLFYWLPLCVLTILVMFAVRNALSGFNELPRLWFRARGDAFVWLATFGCTLLFNGVVGLGAGMLVQLCIMVSRTQWPAWRARRIQHRPGCVLRFEAMLSFSNATELSYAVESCRQKFGTPRVAADDDSQSLIPPLFVFDCAVISAVDTVGAEQLRKEVDSLRKHNFIIRFVSLQDGVRETLARCNFYIERDHVYNSVSDATAFPDFPVEWTLQEETPENEVEADEPDTVSSDIMKKPPV